MNKISVPSLSQCKRHAERMAWAVSRLQSLFPLRRKHLKSYLVGHNSAKDVSYTALEDVLHHHYQGLTS